MPTESPELESALWGALVRLGVPARPVVLPTPWRVGAVNVYLFCDDPVTLVDAGHDSPQSRAGLESAFSAAGRQVGDLERVVVTHAHTDHFGCAAWLQDESGCEVLMHSADVRRLTSWAADRDAGLRELYLPLGATEEALAAWFGTGNGRLRLPEVTPVAGGERIPASDGALRLEHFPGHAPGHLLAVHEPSGAVFGGDYLLAHTPTNAGLDLDPTHPSGRAPMLGWYNQGLRRLAAMDVPVLFGGHGPPVLGHHELIAQRLSKSERRTEHVLRELVRHGPCTAVDLALAMYGHRVERDAWGFMGDVVGRLDLLVAGERAEARKRDDGVWIFTASQGGRHA